MGYRLNFITEFSLEKIIYHLLGFICHQDQTILLRDGENLIPLCPRCLGLHFGFFIALVVVKSFYQKPVNIYKPQNILLIICSISLTGIHWLFGFLNIVEMDFSSRLFTGIVSGAGFFILIISLKYKHVQPELNIAIWEKRVLACLLILLLSLGLFGNYVFILFALLILVTSNIISIILSIWKIIRHNKILNYSFALKKEMQL